MEADCKFKAREEEDKKYQAILTNELMLRHHEGMRKDLSLASENMWRWMEASSKNPADVFLQKQKEMWKEKFWKLWNKMEEVNHNAEKTIAGRGKKRLILDLTGDSDTDTVKEGSIPCTPKVKTESPK